MIVKLVPALGWLISVMVPAIFLTIDGFEELVCAAE
jgi:hypothetical protein